jgi:hypothetical protein
MIDHLTDRINNLMEQNVHLNKKISEDMKLAKNPMNIKVNILAKESLDAEKRLKNLNAL